MTNCFYITGSLQNPSFQPVDCQSTLPQSTQTQGREDPALPLRPAGVAPDAFSDHSGPKLVQLSNPQTVELFRDAVVRATQNPIKAEHVVEELFISGFDEGRVTIENLATFFAIAMWCTNSNDSFYHPFGHFAAGAVSLFLSDNQGVQNKEYDLMRKRLQDAGYSDTKPSDLRKIARTIGAGRFGYLWNKGMETIRGKEIDVDDDFINGPITLHPVKGNLPGFAVQRVHVDGNPVATLIVGNPNNGARVTARIQPKDGVPIDPIIQTFGNRLQFQGPVAMVEWKDNSAIEFLAGEGHIFRAFHNPKKFHGLLIVHPNGVMHICDERQLTLADFTGDPADQGKAIALDRPKDYFRVLKIIRERRLSVMTSLYFERGTPDDLSQVPSGHNYRRLLLEFDDGRFGVIDGEATMTLNDLLYLSWQIPGVRKALYCDTGWSDFASYFLYRDGIPQEVQVGEDAFDGMDTVTNRIIFYQEPLKRSGGE